MAAQIMAWKLGLVETRAETSVQASELRALRVQQGAQDKAKQTSSAASLLVMKRVVARLRGDILRLISLNWKANLMDHKRILLEGERVKSSELAALMCLKNESMLSELRAAKERGAIGVLEFAVKRWSLGLKRVTITQWQINKTASISTNLVEKSKSESIESKKNAASEGGLRMLRMTMLRMGKDLTRLLLFHWSNNNRDSHVDDELAKSLDRGSHSIKLIIQRWRSGDMIRCINNWKSSMAVSNATLDMERQGQMALMSGLGEAKQKGAVSVMKYCLEKAKNKRISDAVRGFVMNRASDMIRLESEAAELQKLDWELKESRAVDAKRQSFILSIKMALVKMQGKATRLLLLSWRKANVTHIHNTTSIGRGLASLRNIARNWLSTSLLRRLLAWQRQAKLELESEILRKEASRRFSASYLDQLLVKFKAASTTGRLTSAVLSWRMARAEALGGSALDRLMSLLNERHSLHLEILNLES